MLQKLNQSNGTSSDAVINKKIKDIADAVTDIETIIAKQTDDITELAADVSDKVSKDELAEQVDTKTAAISDNLAVDSISALASDVININSDINTQSITATEITVTSATVNGKSVSDIDTNATQALATANETADELDALTAVVASNKADFDDYVASETLEKSKVIAKEVEANSVEAASITATKSVADESEIAELNNSFRTAKAFIEPTVKDAESYYLYKLPDFQGIYKLVGILADDSVAFSITFISNNSDTATASNKMGMTQVNYSAKTVSDIAQIKKDFNENALYFLSKSDVVRVYVISDTLDTVEVPTYEIYPDLSTVPTYDLDVTTEQSNHVYFLGDEDTLNGGVTVMGKLNATALEAPGNIQECVYVKCNIYAGYDDDLGAFTTCAVDGSVLTKAYVNDTDKNLTWVTGCCRQVVRNTACNLVAFEDVDTNETGCSFVPDNCDALFDEKALANYDGTAYTGYPIKHLNCETCVHGTIDVECKVVTDCLESHESHNLGIASDGNVGITSAIINTSASCCTNITSPEINVTSACCTNLTSPEVNVSCNLNVAELTTTKNLAVTDTVCGHLEVNGDIRSHSEIIAEKDLVVHGDLYVEGTTTSTNESQVTTSGDYIVTRENNSTGLTSAEYSGLAVNNYTSGCMATITADYCGEWRVSNTATSTATTFTNISAYSGKFYSGLDQSTETTGPSGILSDVIIAELSDVVYYNGSYYKKELTKWYGPISLDSTNHTFDVGSEITDTSIISALEALTQDSLIYYWSVKSSVIDSSENQPLLTRDERACFCNNDILAYDKTNNKATSITRPAINNTVLTAQVDPETSCVSYCWRLDADFDNIYPVGSIYMNYCTTTIPFTQGSWCALTDTFLRATNCSDCVSCTGGSDTVTLDVCNLPVHCHTGPSHAHCVSITSGGASKSMNHAHTGSFGTSCGNRGGSYGAVPIGYTTVTSYVDLSHTHSVTGCTCASGTGVTGNAGEGCAFDIKPSYTNVGIWYRES